MDTISNCDSNLYESSLPPFVRFIHDTQIDPTGWVSVKEASGKNVLKTGLFDACTEITTLVGDVKKYDTTDTSSYVIASFDIECDSSHGDFPMPKKNFKKTASDIFDSYQSILKNISESRRIKFNETMNINLIKLLKGAFTGNFDNFNSIYKYASVNQIYIQNNELPTDEIYKLISNKIMNSNIPDNLINLNIKGKERDSSINSIIHSDL